MGKPRRALHVPRTRHQGRLALGIKNGARRGEFDREGDQEKKRGDQDQKEKTKKNAKCSFDQIIRAHVFLAHFSFNSYF